MDLEEIKKYSKNKIEADNLIKQVRQQIKETTWEKQNLREGFTETFKPLISQFEDPGKDSKKQNIFTQNKEMLQNQLALTEGIRNNQLALKGIKVQQDNFNRSLKQFENLADMEELVGVKDIKDGEDDKDDQAQAPLPKEDKTPIIYNLEKNEIDYLISFNYPRPNNFINVNPKTLEEIYEEVNNHKTVTGNLIGALKRTKQKTEDEKIELSHYTYQHKILSKYKNILNLYLKSIDLKVGEGRVQRGRGLYFSPQELLHRFELLNGSLVAGNNGVLPEYTQIAHRLRDLGIITNNQLNTLLRKVI